MKSYSRKRTPNLIVLHESAVRGRDATIHALEAQGLGVHFTVGRDGSVGAHVPLNRYCWHAGPGRNATSIGIEVVNAYYGSRAVEGETVIPANWAHRGQYILPTEPQLEAVWGLVSTLSVEFRVAGYPGVVNEVFVWDRVEGVTAGIAAHHRWDHSDGLVPEHYCWLRSQGVGAREAMKTTVQQAMSAR